MTSANKVKEVQSAPVESLALRALSVYEAPMAQWVKWGPEASRVETALTDRQAHKDCVEALVSRRKIYLLDLY